MTASRLDDGTEHFQPSSLQVTTIDIGNPATNVIPAWRAPRFNIRFNDPWSSATLKAWIEESLAAVGGKYQLDWEVSGESFLVPPGPVSDCLRGRDRRGDRPHARTQHHRRHLRRALHPRATARSPSSASSATTMHKADERVDVADLSQLTAIYEAFLDRSHLERTRRFVTSGMDYPKIEHILKARPKLHGWGDGGLEDIFCAGTSNGSPRYVKKSARCRSSRPAPGSRPCCFLLPSRPGWYR